jgi:tRNA pseudouridine38-40 synthase
LVSSPRMARGERVRVRGPSWVTMHFRLTVEYDGTEFHGWQVQPGERTVQATIEHALQSLLGHPVRVAAAGRTDAGVHASGQVVCFRTERSFDPTTVVRALDALTPPDIAVLSADVVPDDFDPRRAARRRRYLYRVWNRKVPSPFWRRFAWHIAHPLAVEPMAAAAAVLLGEHDFTSFRAAGCDATHPVRRVLRSDVSVSGDLIYYEIEATAFLRHMVRNIVGTLVEIGSGRRPPGEMEALLAARDRTLAGATAPAHGLCLVAVEYSP